MTDKEKIIEYIDKNRDELVRIASGIISVPSISGRENSNEMYDKEADFLISEFAKFGIEAKKYSQAPGGCNLVAGYTGAGGGKRRGGRDPQEP